MEFNPVEYIDSIATDFSLRGEIPCKGIFYITIYRNFRMGLQAGEYDAEDEVYSNIMLKVLKRILAYGRNYQTTSNIIEEVLEDFEYDEETYEEDDNLKLHLCSLIKNHYDALGGNFSDPHIVRIIRHWNDENMFELEYWVDELMKSVKDNSILQALNRFRSVEDEKFDLEEATEDYVRKFLLLSETGEDLSEETQVLQ